MIQMTLSALFPILAWYGLTTDRSTEAHYRDMAAAHFNISILVNTRPDRMHEDNLKAMEIAGKQGVRLLVHLPEIAQFLKTGNEDDLKKAKEVIRERYRGKPGLYGYMLRDEPNASDFALLARAYKGCLEADPDSLPYINLFPNYANEAQLGTKTYEEHVDRFMKEVRPKVLSYDHYAIVQDGSKIVYRSSYYHNQAVIREAALRYGVPSWAFSLSVPHGPYPMPTEGQIRWQIFHDLAYGTKGIQYFTYETPHDEYWKFHTAILDEKGNKTPTYYAVQRVNGEVAKLGPTLLSLTSTDVMMTGVLDNACKGFEPGPEIAGCAGSPVVLGFSDGPAKSRYLMVVNRDFQEEAKVMLKLAAGVTGLIEISKETGQPLPIMTPGSMGFGLKLAPGDGRLFRIVKG